jgi:hypothetical protein
MRIALRIGVAITAVTVLALVVIVGRHSAHSTNVPSLRVLGQSATQGPDVPGAVRLANLSEVLPNLLPEIAVEGDLVLAYGEVDFSADITVNDFARSTDGGRTFRRMDLSGETMRLSPVSLAIASDDEAIVIGSVCNEPDKTDDGEDEQRCAPTSAETDDELRAFRLNLADDQVTPLAAPPTSGVVTRTMGEVDGTAFFTVTTPSGMKLLGWNGLEWQLRDLPSRTDVVCGAKDLLVAVGANVDDTDAGSALVEPGSPVWTASVSTDAGASWSSPTTYDSEAKRDVRTKPLVTCGPNGLVALSAQMTVFDYGSRRWAYVALPADIAADLPMAAVAWTSPTAARLWIDSPAYMDPANGEFDSSNRLLTQLDVQGLDGRGVPSTSTGGATALRDRSALGLFGQGAPESGLLVLTNGPSFSLGKASA